MMLDDAAIGAVVLVGDDNWRKGPVFVGVDIAARNDLLVIWALESVGDVLWTREIIATEAAEAASQLEAGVATGRIDAAAAQAAREVMGLA